MRVFGVYRIIPVQSGSGTETPKEFIRVDVCKLSLIMTDSNQSNARNHGGMGINSSLTTPVVNNASAAVYTSELSLSTHSLFLACSKATRKVHPIAVPATMAKSVSQRIPVKNHSFAASPVERVSKRRGARKKDVADPSLIPDSIRRRSRI